MKLQYDLILMGGSLEAIWGAKYAANFGARVALIIDIDFATEKGEKYLFQQFKNEFLHPDHFHNRRDILEEKKLLIQSQLLPELESLEVDLIYSDFQFISEKNQTIIKTKKDSLIANGYIMTTPLYDYRLPDGVDIGNINYLTGYDIFKQWDIDLLPHNLIIIGDDAMAVNLAGLLTRYQKQVTLLTPQNHVLPTEDEDIAFLIQCHLESLGINVFTNYQINQFQCIDDSYLIEVNNKAIKCDLIIISDSYLDRKTNFNFDKTKKEKQHIFNRNIVDIIVNDKLKTANKKIYCVGNLLGGYNNFSIVQEELRIAINNILFLPQYNINYDLIPYKINIS